MATAVFHAKIAPGILGLVPTRSAVLGRGIPDCLRGCGGQGSRHRAGASSPNATRYDWQPDHGRRKATYRCSRGPFARTRRDTPSATRMPGAYLQLHSSPASEPSSPAAIVNTVAGGLAPSAERPAHHKSMFHHASSQSDRLDRSHKDMPSETQLVSRQRPSNPSRVSSARSCGKPITLVLWCLRLDIPTIPPSVVCCNPTDV